MKCQWCKREFPHKKGRFCGTCFGPKREEEDKTMMEIDELIHRHERSRSPASGSESR